MPHRAGEQAQRGTWVERERQRSWSAALGLGISLGCACFLAAAAANPLLGAHGGALLSPPAGIGAGGLIVLHGRARACGVLGIFAAAVAADLTSPAGEQHGPWASVVLGVFGAGEALLAAWLVDRWSRRPLKFDDLRGLWGFLAAAALAAAAAGLGTALVTRQLHPSASLVEIWRAGAAANALGIVTFAPLLVGLYRLASERTPRAEWIEGGAALVLLAITSAVVYGAPPQSWLAHIPPAVLFPLLLWIAARCRPAFAAVAAFIVATALAGATTLRLGPFANADLTVPGVQAAILIAALCALILSALFTERRRNEAALIESNERLRLAVSGAQLGVWSFDLTTGAFESDERDARINGHDPAALPRTLAQARRFVRPEDLPGLDAAFAEARKTGEACRAEYRIRSGDPAQSRWVAVEGNVVRDAAGRPIRLLGVTRDITEQKHAEQQTSQLLAELDHRVKNALAVVAAVASRTQQTSGSMADFVAALDGRIQSMASTHELLSGRKWQGIPLAELVERELAPYTTRGNVRIGGPAVVLRAEACQPMAMVVHELVTNAAKYGALSVESGRVSVQWRRTAENGHGASLVLDWLETDGPPVAAVPRTGYGTGVIRDLIPYELGGTVDLVLAPEGVRCRLQIPARWLSGREPPSAAPGDAAVHPPSRGGGPGAPPSALRRVG